MKTLIEKAGAGAYGKGAEIILGGGLVAFPTETVYGLGANAFDADAVSKIFEAKGRPQDNPLIVHVYDKSQIAEIARETSAGARKIIDAFMPGPVTVVLKKSDRIPYSVTAGLDSVGIRMPAKPEARAFLRACGVPVAAPSANISTRISPTSADFVYEHMNGRIPLIIDGGECEVGIESTVIDMSGDAPVILRPGAVTEEMIKEVLSDVGSFSGGDVSKLPSPGMRYRHYAPSIETVVASTPDSAARFYDSKACEGARPVILCRDENAAFFKERNLIALGNNGEEVCKNIYKALRVAEKAFDVIVCEDLGGDGVYGSVMNRVAKAAGGRYV